MIVIVATLFTYTFRDHEFYTNLANKQQIREVELSVNRGTIYGSLDPNRVKNPEAYTPILATTSIVKDLKIDPSGMCNPVLLEQFLSHIVYEHLCLNRSQGSCFDNMMKYANTFVIPENFDFTREKIIDFLRPTIHEQVNRKFKSRILLTESVTDEVQEIIQQ